MSNGETTPALQPAQALISTWEIEAAIGALHQQLYSDRRGNFPHLSYEQGVLEALRWVLRRGPHPLDGA